MNKRILRLAIPNIFSNLSVPLVGLVDIALMGHQNASAYIGAIALGSTVFTFIYAGLLFLRMGTSGFTAQNRGARNIPESFLILGRSLALAFIFGMLLILLQQPISWLAFHFLNASPEVKTIAEIYFKTRIWAAPATLGLYAITGWYIGMQNAKTPMWITISVNLINIAFSLLFILVFDMKARGVALGTLIAQYSGLVIAVLLLLKHKHRMQVFWKLKSLIDVKALTSFMHVNKNILIRSLLLTGCFYFFNAKRAILGNDILAVNSLLLQFLWIFSYFIDGFAFAAEALTGRYIGAGDSKNLKLVIKKLFVWGVSVSMLVSLVYLLFNKGVILLLTDQASVIALSRDYSVWVILMPIISFSAFVWDGIFIGATAGKALRNAMIIAVVFIFVPAIYFFPELWNNHGMWAALSLFMFARGFFLFLSYPKNVVNKS
ncbi:MAG: MATE family efflux transporter [Candidatus Delongbacteria bacterium]|nr:MATE family efflux transporter [Candidatus Delongbacteria bacterium]